MSSQPDSIPAVDAILSGPYWPDRVRVIRAKPRAGGQTRLDPPPAHPDAAHPWDEEYLGPELPVEEWWEEEMAGDGQPKYAPAEASARTTVREPASSLELKSPTTKQSQPRTKEPAGPVQVPLVTDFTPPQGSRSQRLKQVMALGDRVKGNRQDAAAISELVAALADSDDSIRWLAGSALGLLGGSTVVRTLAAFLEQEDAEEARQEAMKVLQRIADDPQEDEEVREMAHEIWARLAETDAD